jgi:hypothetical protein
MGLFFCRRLFTPAVFWAAKGQMGETKSEGLFSGCFYGVLVFGFALDGVLLPGYDLYDFSLLIPVWMDGNTFRFWNGRKHTHARPCLKRSKKDLYSVTKYF